MWKVKETQMGSTNHSILNAETQLVLDIRPFYDNFYDRWTTDRGETHQGLSFRGLDVRRGCGSGGGGGEVVVMVVVVVVMVVVVVRW